MENQRSQFVQDDISRYSRQLILPEIGLSGQLALKNASALVVGAGGLGCPAVQYLAAGGIGRIGVVDYDQVEISNLHRQVLHTEDAVNNGQTKVSSIASAVKRLNSNVKVDEFNVQLSRENAFEIVSPYDVVLDATDNVITRYLVNDICAITKKPLVSGSALRWEGQLTIYNFTSENGVRSPCYRCLYPNPPPPETVTNCSDGGVLGVVPGIIGNLQALEAIKILLGITPSYWKKLLLFDGFSGMFRTVKLRDAQPDCVVCGSSPNITAKTLPNYEDFCGGRVLDKCAKVTLLSKEQRISSTEYKSKYVDANLPHVLLDVREPVELEICSLPNAINVAMKQIEFVKSKAGKGKLDCSSVSELSSLNKAVMKTHEQQEHKGPVPVIVLCRLGNDSQKAVDILQRCIDFKNLISIQDIAGGIMSWAKNIDSSFFMY